MLQLASSTRKQGACLQCRQRKRKVSARRREAQLRVFAATCNGDLLQCDQRQPRCSQCARKSERCSLQVFRITTQQQLQRRSDTRPASSRSSASLIPGSNESSGRTLNTYAEFLPINPPLETTSRSDDPVSEISAIQQLCQSLRQAQRNDFLGCRGWPISEDVPVVIHGSIPTSFETTSPEMLTSDICIPQPSQPRSVLPAELCRSTPRRFLWDYFVFKASRIFLCWEPNDTQLDKDYDDPYAESLPTLAIESRPLRSAALALSAFHYTAGAHSSMSNFVLTSLMSEASQALASSRLAIAQRPRQLLATVGAASLLYLLDPGNYADLLPLSRSAALCLLADPDWLDPGNTPYQVVMQIFRWADICAQCSLMQHVPIPDEATQSRLEIQANEQAGRLPLSFAGWFVHPLYAFAEDLLRPLRRIAWLARVRQQGGVAVEGAHAGSNTSRPDRTVQGCQFQATDTPQVARDRFDALVDEAEHMVRNASSKLHLNRCRLKDSTHYEAPDLRTDLVHLAAAIHSAIQILLSTRLRDVPWTATTIRFHVQNIVEHLCSLKVGSRFSNGVVFPLYVAGLEAVDLTNRLMIINRMQHLPGIWSQREHRLIDSLHHVWKIRDQDPGAVWNSWIHKGTCILE